MSSRYGVAETGEFWRGAGNVLFVGAWWGGLYAVLPASEVTVR